MVTDESPATRRAKLIGGYLGILAVLLLIGLPLFWILMTSFKAKGDIYTDPVNWLPPVWETENYSDATTRVPFWTYLRNSVLITAVLSIIKIVLGVISAYALAILRFPGRHLVFLLVISSLMVPSEITVISNYALVNSLGWRNTFVGIIVPLAGVAFGTFLMRNHFLSLPYELSIIKIVLGVISAYALAILRFPGRHLVFLLVISSLMVPSEITVISNYALVNSLGWRNTFVGIIVPLAGVAFGTFLMRNHFLSLPYELVEAARMDGAGPIRLLTKVLLPVSWPTLTAFSVITMVNEWNTYLWPFLMADTEDVAPLQVGLTMLQNNDGVTNWGPVMAATILTIIPMVIIFLALQKYMIQGLTTGAVKG